MSGEATSAAGGPAPSPWVARFIAGVPQAGRVLDLACGSGRHIRLCLAQGYSVLGVDRDISKAAATFAGSSGLELRQIDLEDGSPFPFSAAAFDGVIVTNYLWRPMLPAIVGAVAIGGLLVYETFRLGNARYGRPLNPDFLLQPEELLRAVRGRLHVVAYEDLTLGAPDRVVQRICAVAPGHPWIEVPPAL